MADNSNTTAVIAEWNRLLDANYTQLATMVFMLYEYVITFGIEVELFWGKELTGASIVFFLNRYIFLAYSLLQLSEWFLSSASGFCSQYYFNTERTLEELCYIPWGAFSALRVFALTDRNWVLSALVFLLSLGPLSVNFAAIHWTSTTSEVACNFETSMSPRLAAIFSFVSRGSLIAADLIVAIVTFITTYKSAILARNVLKHRRNRSFAYLLLRDGMMYFIVLLVMNVLQLSFSLASVLIPAPSGQGQPSDISAVIEPLTAILIWRLMLNLQRVRRRTEGDSRSQNTSSLNFDRIVGSIGESLGSQIAREHMDAGAAAANSDIMTGSVLPTPYADFNTDQM